MHKTAINCAVEFKVFLYDDNGEICTGDHLLSAHVKSACRNIQDVFFGEPEDEKGVYAFSYTPKLAVEYTLDVYVNDTPLSQTPIKLFVVNSPCVDNSSVSGEGVTKAVKNKVASFQVFLADKEGSPVNSEQSVTAQLRLPSQDTECLVLPMQVTMCDLPSVYSVSYMPSVCGDCELTVLVNEEPLVDSQVIIVGITTLMPLAGAASQGELEFVKLLLNQGEELVSYTYCVNIII